MKTGKIITAWILALVLAGLLAACTAKPDVKPEVSTEETVPPAESTEEAASLADSTEGSAAETAAPSAAAETPETAAPSDVSEESDTALFAEVEGNNSYCVRVGDRIFYRIPAAGGMSAAALFGEYQSTECGPAELVSYDLTTGEEVHHLTDNAWGPMVISDGFLFFNAGTGMGDTSENFTVCYDTKAPAATEYKNYYLEGGDKQGRLAVLKTYGKEGIDLTVLEGDQLRYTGRPENYAEFYGIYADALYYRGEDEGSSLYMLDIPSGKIVNLGKLPDGPEGSYGGELCQFTADEDGVYLSYGFYEGTGHFYASGFYVQAKPGVSNSISFEESPASLQEEPTAPRPFAVADGKMIPADGIPGSAALDYQSGELSLFDESGKKEASLEGYASVDDETGEKRVCVELVQAVAGKIYAVINLEHHVPQEDIGWRWAYEREESYAVLIDPVTGEETQIGFTEHP